MSRLQTPLLTTDLYRLANRLPRVGLAHLPTPLEELPRFSHALGGPPILIKRDDCTGLAMGGNKTRHNEFVVGHARELGADLFVWGAGVQSNNCRQTAAACARFGLDCHLVLSRANHDDSVQGNLLLDYLLGASVEIVDLAIGPELFTYIDQVAARYRAQGRRPYSWVNETVKPRAAVSYALCLAEIIDQLAGRLPSAVYVSSGGSTGSGLLLGQSALALDCRLRIIAPIRWPHDHAQDQAKTANEAAQLLGLAACVEPEDVDTTFDYIGEGYGIPTTAGLEALDLLARTEGILLDPVYTGKAMAALIDDVRSGNLPPDQPVVFIHTGGTPALFAYRDELMSRRL